MSKKKDKQAGKASKDQARPDDVNARSGPAQSGPDSKMKTKDYEREMAHLHAELVAMQEWVKSSGAKICIVFEGRDTAGKGGTCSRNFSLTSGVQKPMTGSTPARLYQLRSKITTSPPAGKCGR